MDEMKERLAELVKPFVSGSACESESGSCEFTTCRSCKARTLAYHLLTNGAFLPPCKVGDTAYMLLEDNVPVHKWYISEERVTEVGARGFWLSGVEPAEDDLGVFIPYDEVGSEAFFDRAAAEAAMKKKEVAQDGVD